MSLGAERFRAKGLRKADKGKHPRWRGAGVLNLVSLMDIFTILVFFLLVNSADVETLSGKTSVVLPESISTKKPAETLVLVVNNKNIVLQGRTIANIDDEAVSKHASIEPLKKELSFHYARLFGDSTQKNQTGAITIMGDKAIPYSLLKKIMMTCAEANFGNISLAVQQKALGEA